MILPFTLADIVGAKISPDNTEIAVVVATDANDRFALGMSVQMLDAMLETLSKARAQLDGAGVERTVAWRSVMEHGVAVSTQEVDGHAFVGLMFDRGMPTCTAFLMPPKAAREVARGLTRQAQEAASVRAANGSLAPAPRETI